MLSWDKTDKLNRIATNVDMTPEERIECIQAFWRKWGEDTNYRGAYAANTSLFGSDDIDSGKECVRAKMPIPGQTGRTVYVGLYEH